MLLNDKFLTYRLNEGTNMMNKEQSEQKSNDRTISIACCEAWIVMELLVAVLTSDIYCSMIRE